MATPAMESEVETSLRSRGVRYTPGRRAVVDVMAGADGPRSAAELSEQLGSAVPLSSLYRSLAVLEEAGVVVPHFAKKGLTRYELAEWLTGHHHHVVCINCGAVEDIKIPTKHEEQVRSLVADIAKEVSFEATDHVLEIEGRCALCR